MDTQTIVTVIILSIALVAIVLLGTLVLIRNPHQRVNQSFFFLALSGTLWIFTNLLFAIIDQPTIQYSVALVSYASGGLMALFFWMYALALSGRKITRIRMTLLYIVGLLMTAQSMIPGNLATGVEDGRIITNTLPLTIYGIYCLFYLVMSLFTLIWARTKAYGVDRSRLTIVLLGLATAAIVAFTLNLALPFMGNYTFVKFGPLAALLFIASSTYAIIRHRLFDIKLAAVRTITYACALLTLSGVYYLLAYLLSVVVFNTQSPGQAVSINLSNIFLALVLAFLFQPIKRFFDRMTNNVFYRDVYNSEDFFNILSNLLTSTIDLRNLLERASQQMALTFKAEQVSFFVYYGEENEHHMSAGTANHARLPTYDIQMIDRHVTTNPKEKIFLVDLLAEDDAVRRMLQSHRIAIVMPLKRGDTTVGYLLLGDHRSGGYTKRDLNVLLAVSNELVIAIQNALSLQELKELNATLQQRIDVATKELRSSNAQLKHLDEVKDEFMSMASHQLRTPLTSVKGYISMVLEGDAGKVSPQQDKLLTEAFKSSERMVRLIADFLNVSRLQTGKFSIEKAPMDIKETVRQEVENLDFIAHTHNQKIRATVTHDALPLRADESKVRQVIMNLIDNAIYYSHPHTTIVVRLEKVGDSAAFTVTDTGIGVPEDEQHKLFGKFFRAGNARKQRPDGTGVGLYLARRVVTGHGGSIIFSSKEGKGSTFGFKLPLDTSGK